jgi:hypothetical protein
MIMLNMIPDTMSAVLLTGHAGLDRLQFRRRGFAHFAVTPSGVVCPDAAERPKAARIWPYRYQCVRE